MKEDKKYELIEDYYFLYEGRELYRIRALKDISSMIKSGDIGGYVEGYHNLSQEGACWIFDDAKVYGNARIEDDAVVEDCAKVYGNAVVKGSAWVGGEAKVYENARLEEDVSANDNTQIFGNAIVKGVVLIKGAEIYDNARISQYIMRYNIAWVLSSLGKGDIKKTYTLIFGNTKIYGNAIVEGSVLVEFGAKIYDNAIVKDQSQIAINSEVHDNTKISTYDI